jgi:hypothetical protein
LIVDCRFEDEEPQINQQPIIALDGPSKMAPRFLRDLSFDRLEEVFHLD